MLFLLDTNVLIEAKNLYYPLDRIPQFWAWIVWHAELGQIKIPTQVIVEIERGREDDDLLIWVKSNRKQLEFSEDIDEIDWLRMLTIGYGFSPTEVEEEALVDKRADPYLVALALSNTAERCIVTLESSKALPRNLPLPSNRKIPTVCDLLNIRHINTFELIRELDFRIP